MKSLHDEWVQTLTFSQYILLRTHSAQVVSHSMPSLFNLLDENVSRFVSYAYIPICMCCSIGAVRVRVRVCVCVCMCVCVHTCSSL